MKLLVLTCCVALAATALAMTADGWVEPTYADANAEAVEGSSFLEDGTRVGAGAKGKVRGISHTVSGRHGMVTYISPARHIQTSGIVLTPPPSISVQTVAAPQPVYLQPVVVPHAEYHYAVGGHDHHDQHHHNHHHLPHLTDDDYSVEEMYGHSNGEHVLHRTGIETHLPGHHHHAHAHLIPHDSRHHSWGHHHSHGHYVPSHSHGRVHIGSGVHAGDVHVHPYAPVAVPASLLNTPYHQPHYGHDSPVSQGPIFVPHTPEGAIALESADYAGYNPGPAIQYHSAPTSYYSDGTPHRATINQRFN